MKLHGQARGIPFYTVAPEGALVERNPAPKDHSSTGKPVVFWGVDNKSRLRDPVDCFDDPHYVICKDQIDLTPRWRELHQANTTLLGFVNHQRQAAPHTLGGNFTWGQLP